MNTKFPEYTTQHISASMSLRMPQEESLNRLDNILRYVPLAKDADLEGAVRKVNSLYNTCTDFERDFMSLTFALATGVGKTRLMGAFIAYLYTNHNIRHFFVVAPNKTIYEKLASDLGDVHNPKYVFHGVSCFALQKPYIISAKDYNMQSVLDTDAVQIFVFNIDKFNKDESKIKSINEFLGDSFYKYLSSLKDLVLIMDESHHYRAEKGFAAVNELRPVLGLELTATPYITSGSKQINFKNVVYEYRLYSAIADGFVRTPYAVTRQDINFYEFGDDALDKLMITDGVVCHEDTKKHLQAYAQVHAVKPVKPFMMIVCKDTAHANWAKDFVTSPDFHDGYYADKTIIVHSKQKGAESEENTALLLNVEKADNPVEIVIHVNMLKEGWDVNNLYTIVPLRTAASKILREQMVGRGLRLPYGKRTGDSAVDAVRLTAHDKFKEILEEAQKGDSIFSQESMLQAEDISRQNVVITQYNFVYDDEKESFFQMANLLSSDKNENLYDAFEAVIADAVTEKLYFKTYADNAACTKDDIAILKQNAVDKISEAVGGGKFGKDFAEIYAQNKDPFIEWAMKSAEKTYKSINGKYIPIPQIIYTAASGAVCYFNDFELDMKDLNYAVTPNDLIATNIVNRGDTETIKADSINFDCINPSRAIAQELAKKAEIDYARDKNLIVTLVNAFCSFYKNKYGAEGLRHIVMMNRRDIVQKIFEQMMRHFTSENLLIAEEVSGVCAMNKQQSYNAEHKCSLYDNWKEKFGGSIKSILFTMPAEKSRSIFHAAKFDSEAERLLAQILEHDSLCQKWLRPAKEEFNISYKNNRRYEPDFVIETDDMNYLVEVKRDDETDDEDVLAKKESAINYCKIASTWAAANGFKEWRHLFIPASELKENSSLRNIIDRWLAE